jgi:hypothetical protein
MVAQSRFRLAADWLRGTPYMESLAPQLVLRRIEATSNCCPAALGAPKTAAPIAASKILPGRSTRFPRGIAPIFARASQLTPCSISIMPVANSRHQSLLTCETFVVIFSYVAPAAPSY